MKSKITAIKALKNPRIKRSSIFLDGKFAFSVDNEVILKEAIQVDQELTAAEIDLLTGADRFQRCLNAAFQFLSFRPRSEAETRIRLQRKGYTDAEIEKTMTQLIRLNLINDNDFAVYWKENRNNFRPRSQRMLKLELKRKGVESEIINEAVEKVDESENAYRASISKARTLSVADYPSFRRKLGSYLQRRGFSYGVINKVVKQVWQEKTGNTGPVTEIVAEETD